MSVQEVPHSLYFFFCLVPNEHNLGMSHQSEHSNKAHLPPIQRSLRKRKILKYQAVSIDKSANPPQSLNPNPQHCVFTSVRRWRGCRTWRDQTVVL